MQEEQRLLDYASARIFLIKAIQQKQRTRRGYSLSAISKRAGMRSPSGLSMILNGRRGLSSAVAERIALALRLDEVQSDYLNQLVRLEQSVLPQEKQKIEERILELKKLPQVRILTEEEELVLENPLAPIIHGMMGLPDFRWSARWIQRRLAFSASQDEIEAAMSLLKLSDMVTAENQRKNSSVRAEHRVEGLLHQFFLRQAEESLDLPREMREFGALVNSLPKESLPQLKEKLRRFIRELHHWTDSQARSEASELVSISFQCIPLTKKASARKHQSATTVPQSKATH